MTTAKSKHAVDGEIINIRRGLAIYKTFAGPYYYARIRDPKTKKYVVRSTKETSRITARAAAEELALMFGANERERLAALRAVVPTTKCPSNRSWL